MANIIKMNPLHAVAPAPVEKLPNLASPDGVVHDASRVSMGGAHSYLGHFAKPENLMAGHNTSGHLPSLKTKHSGSFHGKSNALGHGGRAAQLKARGVPGGVIGMMARKAHAAPGQANYHGHKKGK